MTRPLRFLFVMHYPGYLRYFDSTVHLLAEHGHQVEIVFDSPDKQSEGTEAVAGVDRGIELIGQMPVRRGAWATVAKGVRGTIDYIRYWHPDFVDTPYLRDRMRPALPPLLAFLGRRTTSTPATMRRWVRTLTACERAIPSSRVIEEFIAARRPDAVLVTPLVTDRSPQCDVIKSAQALGIPTALCVASWDHLTTKGLIRVEPDLIAVWNEEQRAEALEYHGTPNERIVVTGAQPFDKWFERQPTMRETFCDKVGLRADRPFILFVGSTKSISAPDAELRFVRRWVDALRRHPELREVGILIRPHPFNVSLWQTAEFPDLPNVAIYPRSANPVNERDRQDYFDSLYHCAAVVGVNTTAMIEAAIVGRTVHSVLADEFRDTQGGTLHFRYLLAENGGFLRVAPGMDEHARQLVETLQNPDVGEAACARFVARFVRPHGVQVAATPKIASALEDLAARGATPAVTVPVHLYPLQAVLWLIGFVSTYYSPARIAGFVRKQIAIGQKKLKHTRKALARARGRASTAPARHRVAPTGVPDQEQSNAPTRRVG